MTVITLREQHPTDTGFAAELIFDGRSRYPITLTDPFSPAQERRLEWYFELSVRRIPPSSEQVGVSRFRIQSSLP